MRLKHLWTVLAMLAASCATTSTPSPVVKPQPRAEQQNFCVAPNVHVGTVTGTPVVGAHVFVAGASGDTNKDGYLYLYPVAEGQTTIHVTADGFVPADVPYLVSSLVCDIGIVLTPTLPPAPTRAQVTNICLSFQGLTVQTSFGAEPYFEASLAWHPLLSDRQAIYAAKHAARNLFCPNGDTHAIIHVPFGTPLYDEPGQFYTADKFPALDWTNGLTKMDPKFIALVIEVRQNGFIPIITHCGDGSDPSNYACAMKQAPLLIAALQHDGPRDLTEDVAQMPGYDGVFYGWGRNADETRREINSWYDAIRGPPGNCPRCILGLEHGTGHIPIGDGPADWQPGGDMQQRLDFLLSEFDDGRFDDSVWQISARTIGPAYIRPPEQPSGDDPRPPFYLAYPGPRGPIAACAFEFYTYGWVRNSTLAEVLSARQYFKHIGYSCGG